MLSWQSGRPAPFANDPREALQAVMAMASLCLASRMVPVSAGRGGCSPVGSPIPAATHGSQRWKPGLELASLAGDRSGHFHASGSALQWLCWA